MPQLTEGRAVIVTGAGGGIGRAEALEFARQGASVVVNDLGDAAVDVVAEIQALGGTAVANSEDVSDWDGAKRLIDAAVNAFGRLDVLVNNAGILRDRMLVNMAPEEWDDVIKVHLRGTFAPSRHAAAYWRECSKSGQQVDARIINTSSAAGLYGNLGQANYAAAKAGIAALTIVAAEELGRYGITVNAIAPAALTRMTEGLRERSDEEKAQMAPENIAPLVVWLGSAESADITGRLFNVKGGWLSVAEGWVSGPEADNGTRWAPAQLSDVVPSLVAKSY
ncbi:SDR family oxidoreductase [Saccharopolyspora shandongensis]|uniref:SDR family oxidoreductase n=1 Tax=Saccharopolyspora shandongensis TaxID=418495 RepID=UPI0033E371DC